MDWFDPTPLDLPPTPLGPFPQSLPLTADGDVTVVPLPGHSPGHVGVLVEDGNHTVLLAGDSSYTQELMLRGVVEGVGPRRSSRTTDPRPHPRLHRRTANRLSGRTRPRSPDQARPTPSHSTPSH